MHNYIFDLDGTLINSFNEVIKCFINAFEKVGYPLDKSRLITDIIGPPLDEIVQNLVPELHDKEKLAELVNAFNYFYDNEESDISCVYEGVYDVLDHLKRTNNRLFMATYKPLAPTTRIIKQFELTPYFEEVYTIDMFGDFITKSEMIKIILEKYFLRADDTCMVGDAVSDMACAKSAGVKAIGALWGYGSQKQALMDSSDIVIKSIRDLLNLSEDIFSIK